MILGVWDDKVPSESDSASQEIWHRLQHYVTFQIRLLCGSATCPTEKGKRKLLWRVFAFEIPPCSWLGSSLQNKKYKLYGMVNHMGSLRGGHYTATILSNEDNTWYECNDDYVKKVRVNLTYPSLWHIYKTCKRNQCFFNVALVLQVKEPFAQTWTHKYVQFILFDQFWVDEKILPKGPLSSCQSFQNSCCSTTTWLSVSACRVLRSPMS